VCAPVGDGRTLEVGSVEVEDDVTVQDDAEDDVAVGA
jgi:hypothetical protein